MLKSVVPTWVNVPDATAVGGFAVASTVKTSLSGRRIFTHASKIEPYASSQWKAPSDACFHLTTRPVAGCGKVRPPTEIVAGPGMTPAYTAVTASDETL